MSRPRKHPTPRTFGRVRKLPSGRFQARYSDATGRLRPAPTTFDTKTAADQWLSTQRADLLRGVWRDPDAGAITLTEYMRTWLAQRTDLAASTRYGYTVTVDRWIDRDLSAPTPRGGKPGTINIGSLRLDALNPTIVREWFAACHATQLAEKRERDQRGRAWQYSRSKTSHIRAWARANGYTVANTGRLSPTVLGAWRRAGSPGTPAGQGFEGLDLSGKPAAVIVQAYRSLRACLNAALDDGLIQANPCRLRGAAVHHAASRPIATPEEVRALAAAMPPHLSAAVEVAAWSALRAGELFGLARRHVDLDAATLTVERALVYVPGELPRFGPPKTASSLRTVNLPSFVIKLLRQHMEEHTRDAPDALVFANLDGTPVTTPQRVVLFDRARRSINRLDLRWHDLRHTGATLAARAGASVRELQHRLGHSTYDAAMRYQHASAERDRELADRLDAYAPETVATVLSIAK